MIARSCRSHSGAEVEPENRVFRQICQDILSSETSRLGTRNNHKKVKDLVNQLVSGVKKKKSVKNIEKSYSNNKEAKFLNPKIKNDKRKEPKNKGINYKLALKNEEKNKKPVKKGFLRSLVGNLWR